MLSFIQFQESRMAFQPGKDSLSEDSVADFKYSDGTDDIFLISLVPMHGIVKFLWGTPMDKCYGLCMSQKAAEQHLYEQYYIPRQKENILNVLNAEYKDFCQRNNLGEISSNRQADELNTLRHWVYDWRSRVEGAGGNPDMM